MAKAKKIVIDMTCPFCGDTVIYWANCSRRTAKDYEDHEYVQTKRGKKQYFHRSCYMKNTIGAKLREGAEDVREV